VGRVDFSPRARADLDRILDHLVEHGAENAAERVVDIVAALDVLTRNPLMGRPAGHRLRELVIGRESRGYVALYEYRADLDAVRVVAIRGQREAGY
jgi:toxin ParE1/3/4